jgi:hypothetical protein
VFTARYALSPYIKQTPFVFKGLPWIYTAGRSLHISYMDRDNVIGLTTRYDLDGPGTGSRLGQNFLHLSGSALGPTQPPLKWVPCPFAGSKSDRGVHLTTHPYQVKERVELHLYSACLPTWHVYRVNFTSPVHISYETSTFFFRKSLLLAIKELIQEQ